MTEVAQPQELTLHQVAEILGVHYMTVYRYVRLGQLPAFKAGGTWRVHPGTIDAFRSGRLPTAAMTTEEGGRRDAPWSERFETRLIAGDARGAWQTIEQALAAGSSIEAAYLDIVATALRSIGDRWARGEIDIAIEHRASSVCLGLVARLGSMGARRGRTKGTVIVGAPAGERHALPLAILAECVRLDGWQVSDLGADVPLQSFVYAVDDDPDVVAVGVSVSLGEHLSTAQAVVSALRAAHPQVCVVLGGAAIANVRHARLLGADRYAPDARGFVALLRDRDELPRAESSG